MVFSVSGFKWGGGMAGCGLKEGGGRGRQGGGVLLVPSAQFRGVCELAVGRGEGGRGPPKAGLQ